MNEFTIQKRLRDTLMDFRFSTPPPEEIEKRRVILEDCLEWSRDHHQQELENDSLWGLYLCSSRLNRPSEAADALLALQGNLEKIREGIDNPFERGGVFLNYPLLYNALCEKLYMSGRTHELLEAIEASKGRGIADILTKNTGTSISDSSIYKAVDALPALTRKFKFHYLSYYVDEERTYMVLAGKDGGIHAVEAVEISRIAIRDASKYVDPKHWGEPDEVEPDIIIKNISEHLAPLVNALNPLVDKGVLKPGDHICYSGDDHFSNIPLQYLLFNGKPMIHCFTLSRIQNASHLVEVLSRPARKAPRQFVSFIAPLKQDTTKENWDEINQNFHKPTECLKQLLNTNDPVYKNQSATISQLCREDLCDKIIQFSTHGIFPLQTEIGNPFEQSGLVLAHNGELPDSDAVGSGNLEGVLTPRTILDLNLDFNESHLSLTACVSGLSKEGIGGDALGIEWALIQKGAGSILSSHWFVSAESAARFFECYYTHWIKEKKSRAKAYSAAIKTLNEEQSPDWAAFSLTGDWR